MARFTVLALGLAGVLAGCGIHSSSTVQIAPGSARYAPFPAEQVFLTSGDITDRPYETLGDIRVDSHKSALLEHDPTHGDIDAELRRRAAAMGANAVVLVRYGSVGIEWNPVIGLQTGVLRGSGRAVVVH